MTPVDQNQSASKKKSNSTTNNKKRPNLIAGLDIGTTKVSVIIGVVEVDTTTGSPETKLDVIGLGSAPSLGIRQGAVVNVEATIEAIQKAREEAELMAGYNIDSVYVSVGGIHIKSFDSQGMIAIRNKEVRAEDIARVIEAAKAVAVPGDREVLHVLPREYKIDGQEGIYDPIGMSGVRLESNVHLVTAGRTALQNAIKCAEKAGLKVKGIVLQQLASAMAILQEDEKKLGVAVVDMGGGTSDVIIYINGSVAYTGSVPVGGTHFTQDIAMGLRTPQANAEAIKKKYGCAITELIDENETIEVEGVGGRKPRSLLRRNLCEVIEPRAEETLALINQEIEKSGLAGRMGSGVVLTGGASQLEGLLEMGEFIMDVPVRRGLPEKIGGLSDVVKSPAYATAVGLLLYGLDLEKQKFLQQSSEVDIQGAFLDFAQKVKDLFSGALS